MTKATYAPETGLSTRQGAAETASSSPVKRARFHSYCFWRVQLCSALSQAQCMPVHHEHLCA